MSPCKVARLALRGGLPPLAARAELPPSGSWSQYLPNSWKTPFSALLLFTSTGHAAPVPAQRPSVLPLRYDEDWSSFRNSDLRQHPLDPLKFIRLNQDATWWLTLGGETRQRYEYFQNANWGAGPQDENGYWMQRYMVHGDLHYQDHFRLFTQFKSGWRLGPYRTWTLSYAHFFAGPFLTEHPPGEDVDYVSTWLTFRF